MSPSNMQDFSHPTTIDNELFPLEPGTEWVYKGTVTELGVSTPHEVLFTVSTLTKVIDGVRTRVVWDRDFGEGELEEVELAFFAQDDEGRVWNFGEYPEEFANGKFDAAPNVWSPGWTAPAAASTCWPTPRSVTPTSRGSCARSTSTTSPR